MSSPSSKETRGSTKKKSQTPSGGNHFFRGVVDAETDNDIVLLLDDETKPKKGSGVQTAFDGGKKLKIKGGFFGAGAPTVAVKALELVHEREKIRMSAQMQEAVSDQTEDDKVQTPAREPVEDNKKRETNDQPSETSSKPRLAKLPPRNRAKPSQTHTDRVPAHERN